MITGEDTEARSASIEVKNLDDGWFGELADFYLQGELDLIEYEVDRYDTKIRIDYGSPTMVIFLDTTMPDDVLLGVSSQRLAQDRRKTPVNVVFVPAAQANDYLAVSEDGRLLVEKSYVATAHGQTTEIDHTDQGALTVDFVSAADASGEFYHGLSHYGVEHVNLRFDDSKYEPSDAVYAERAGVRFPESIQIDSISELSSRDADRLRFHPGGFVVKPLHSSNGVGVRMYRCGEEPELEVIARNLHDKGAHIMQQRIRSPNIEVGESSRDYGWNMRTIAYDGRVICSYVRIGLDVGPINKSTGAFGETKDDFARRFGDLESFRGKQYLRQMERAAARVSAEAGTKIVGVDTMYDDDLDEAVLIEVNHARAGGLHTTATLTADGDPLVGHYNLLDAIASSSGKRGAIRLDAVAETELEEKQSVSILMFERMHTIWRELSQKDSEADVEALKAEVDALWAQYEQHYLENADDPGMYRGFMAVYKLLDEGDTALAFAKNYLEKTNYSADSISWVLDIVPLEVSLDRELVAKIQAIQETEYVTDPELLSVGLQPDIARQSFSNAYAAFSRGMEIMPDHPRTPKLASEAAGYLDKMVVSLDENGIVRDKSDRDFLLRQLEQLVVDSYQGRFRTSIEEVRIRIDAHCEGLDEDRKEDIVYRFASAQMALAVEMGAHDLVVEAARTMNMISPDDAKDMVMSLIEVPVTKSFILERYIIDEMCNDNYQIAALERLEESAGGRGSLAVLYYGRRKIIDSLLEDGGSADASRDEMTNLSRHLEEAIAGNRLLAHDQFVYLFRQSGDQAVRYASAYLALWIEQETGYCDESNRMVSAIEDAGASQMSAALFNDTLAVDFNADPPKQMDTNIQVFS